MSGIGVKVRTDQSPLWRSLRTARRRILTCHIPVTPATRPLFRVLYGVHVAAREGLEWLLRLCWYEPLFRSQCERVGSGFRMERLPYISGCGTLLIGSDVRLSGKSGFSFGSHAGNSPRIEIGDGTFIGHECGFFAGASISIGSCCLLAGRVTVRDHDGHPIDPEQRRRHEPVPPGAIKPVIIEDDVWIGAGAVILKGVRIGARAVIGAGAVVTRDVPAGCMVAGNPARVVRDSLDSPTTLSSNNAAPGDRVAA